MKLTALRLYNVKLFAGRGIAIEGIGDGVNVLSAENEAGKSTSFEALHALFFEPHTSTRKVSVGRLRPYAGGNPLVQVDVETNSGRFRITKQYIGSKSARVVDLANSRLVAQADEAEHFIDELVSGGARGPAGLLWVRQGLNELEGRGNKLDKDDLHVRESLLTSVQGEVEAVTGGRRMQEIMDRCKQELDALATPTLKPKSGSPYAEALSVRDKLAMEKDRLEEEVDQLRDALERRVTASNSLQALQNAADKDSREAEIANVRKAVEEARLHASKVGEAEAKLEQVRLKSSNADKELSDFRDSHARAKDVAEKMSTAQAELGSAQQVLEKAQAIYEDAQARVEAAEEADARARVMLAKVRAADAARQAREQLSSLQAKLETAEESRKGIEAAEAALAGQSLSEKAMESLRSLETRIAGLRGQVKAGLPTLHVRYEDGGAQMLMDGKQLAEGAEHVVRATARINIPGSGVLTIRSNHTPKAAESLKEAEDTKQHLLAKLGVQTLVQAEDRLAEARKAREAIALQRRDLELTAPDGLPALRAEVARLAGLQVADLPVGLPDLPQAEEATRHAEQEVHSARNRGREVQPLLAAARQKKSNAELACGALETEMEHLNRILGPSEARSGHLQALQDACERLSQDLQKCETKAQDLRRDSPNIALLEARLAKYESAQKSNETRERSLETELAELNGAIKSQADQAVEEVLQETVEKLAVAQRRVEAFEAEVATLKKLLEALQSARSAARDQYLRPVLMELRPLLSVLFDDVSIQFDEKTLLPTTLNRNGVNEDIDRLSGGMREQLSILTRLAFARLLARSGRNTPVILDDALVYSDDDRIERMFDALHMQANDQQIIVFSCRQRAFLNLGGNILLMRDWTPPNN